MTKKLLWGYRIHHCVGADSTLSLGPSVQRKKTGRCRRQLSVRVGYDCNNRAAVSSECPSAPGISRTSAERDGYTQE